jgi:hypothetical protein
MLLDYATRVASARHRDLIAEAERYRLAKRARPADDCRVPVGKPPCRPDPRSGKAPSRIPATAVRGHRRLDPVS